MTISRRTALRALGGLGALALGACTGSGAGGGPSPARPDGPAPRRIAYGSDPSQFGELHLPPAGTTRRPGTAVVVHGGFWQAGYGVDLGTPLAADLAARGWAAWNLEYRRVGNGGGWPATFADVAAGIDALADAPPSAQLDLTRVVAIGHSAGGQLAAWAAGRGGLPTGAVGAAPRVALTGVVAQAGVLDLTRAAREGVGGRAVPQLMGGGPEEAPDRYALADPQRRLPLPVPVLCLHSRADANVPFDQSEGYVAAARAAGGTATLRPTSGDHFTLIDPDSADWAIVVDALPALLG